MDVWNELICQLQGLQDSDHTPYLQRECSHLNWQQLIIATRDFKKSSTFWHLVTTRTKDEPSCLDCHIPVMALEAPFSQFNAAGQLPFKADESSGSCETK